MEGEKIVKRRLNQRRLLALGLACTLFITLIASNTTAIPWTSIVGLLMTAITGLIGLIIAWIALAIVNVVNAFLVKGLFCALILSPSFYGSGYASTYAGGCLIPASSQPAAGLTNMIRMVLGILYPIFALMVVALGAYLIFMASSPPHRARAKQMLMKVFIAMMIAALAPPIYQLLLMVSGALTDGVLDIINLEILRVGNPVTICPLNFFNTLPERLTCAFNSLMPIPGTDPNEPITDAILRTVDLPRVLSAIAVLSVTAVLWILAIIVAMFRYVAVVFLGVMFPLTIAFYMFELTRNIGRKMMKMTFVFILTPAIMAFWLATALAILPYARSTGNFFTGLMLLTLMSAMVSISPLQLSGMLNLLGSIVTSVGQLAPGIGGTALVAAGGLMQGRGPTAVAGAAMKYSGGKLLKGGGAIIGSALGGGFKAGAATAMDMMRKPFKTAAGAVGKMAGAATAGIKGAAQAGKWSLMGGLIGERAYGRGVGRATGAVSGAAKGVGRGAWGAGVWAGRRAYGGTLGAAAGAAKRAGSAWSRSRAAGRGRFTSSMRAAGSAAFGGKIGQAWGKTLSKNMFSRGYSGKYFPTLGKAGRMAAKVAVAKGVEKVTGGLIAGKDILKSTPGMVGAGVKGMWGSIKGVGAALPAFKLGAAAAWRGAKASLRTGWKGMGTSLRNANWRKIGKTVGKGLGIGAVVAGAALGGGLVGAAVAGAGLSMLSKGVRTMAKEGVKRTAAAAWTAVKQSTAGRSMAAAYKSVRDKGLGRSIGAGLKQAGKAAAGFAASLSKRGIQKALGLTNEEVKRLGERGNALADRRGVEKQKGRTGRMLENAGSKDPESSKKFEKDWEKTSEGDKKALASMVNVDPDPNTNPNWKSDVKKKVQGADDSQRKQLTEGMDKSYDRRIDDIEKKGEIGNYAPHIEDKKLAKMGLQEGRPIGGVGKDTAEDLNKMGIRTKGDLAGMSDEQADRMARISSQQGYNKAYTADELKGMREGAKKAIKRLVKPSEQYKLDRGMSVEELETGSRTDRERDRLLKEMIASGGSRKQPMREDFLTALEEERQ